MYTKRNTLVYFPQEEVDRIIIRLISAGVGGWFKDVVSHGILAIQSYSGYLVLENLGPNTFVGGPRLRTICCMHVFTMLEVTTLYVGLLLTAIDPIYDYYLWQTLCEDRPKFVAMPNIYKWLYLSLCLHFDTTTSIIYFYTVSSRPCPGR